MEGFKANKLNRTINNAFDIYYLQQFLVFNKNLIPRNEK